MSRHEIYIYYDGILGLLSMTCFMREPSWFAVWNVPVWPEHKVYIPEAIFMSSRTERVWENKSPSYSWRQEITILSDSRNGSSVNSDR